jgi:hypothetical protein
MSKFVFAGIKMEESFLLDDENGEVFFCAGRYFSRLPTTLTAFLVKKDYLGNGR